MPLKNGTTKIKRVAIGNEKYKKVCIGSDKVWSGASIVSYYDGSTLIGREEVDEGLDVLHPSFSTAKSGYTLIGWAKIKNGSKQTSLVANGEPITLYALYLANTLTILSATLNTPAGQVNPYYSIDSYNPDYISSPTYASAIGYYNNAYSSESTETMYVSIGLYGTMTVKGTSGAWGNDVVTKIDGTNASGTEVTKTYHTSRTITMYAKGSHPSAESWHVVRCGCTSIVLSNPTPWS